MRRLVTVLSAGLLVLSALSGCIVVHKYEGPPPPPPPAPVHVHTEYCTIYTDMYGCPHSDIVWLESRGCDWDDMGIVFYLWWGCGRRYPIHEIHRWHYAERAEWSVCFTRARVDFYGMYVHVDSAPPGPCGRVYGYYERREPVEHARIHDDDVRAAFRVNVAVNYYKVPPQQAYSRVQDRNQFHAVVKEEHVRQNRPAWEHTPEGRKEVEQENRGRGPGAAPAPGRGSDNRNANRNDSGGRGPGATPAPGGDRGRDDRRPPASPPGADRSRDDTRPPAPPPGADRGRDDRRPPAPPPGADRGRDDRRPPESRRPDDNRSRDDGDREGGQDSGSGGGKKNK